MSVDTEFDAVVVGSGITGGWAAKELTEHGLKVLVLERGKPLTHGGYPTEHVPPWEMPGRNLPQRALYANDYFVQRNARGFDFTTLHFWNNDRENPYVQVPGKPFNWFRTDVVGGRSLMWGRHSYRWSEMDFAANGRDGHGNDWPIRYRDVAPWYSHVERFIGVSGEALGIDVLPDGEFQPPMTLNVVEQAFKTRVERRFPGRHVTIGRVANLTEPLGERKSCHYCGPCQRGCTAGAYFSSLSSTLPAARRTGNLTLLANQVVESLELDGARGRVTAVRAVDTLTRERTRYRTKVVFLCASTFASLQILLNSRSERFPGGLANFSGTLGRFVMDHNHGQGAAGVMPGFESKYYYGNRPNTFYIPRFRNLERGKDEVEFIRGYGYQGLALPDDWTMTWHRIPGFGADYKQALRRPGRWMLFMLGFGEVLPYADNRVVLDSKVDRFGTPQLRFEVTYRDNERLMGLDMAQQAIAMLEAAGATDILPFSEPFIPGTSIHEYGGARMGRDAATSVVNEHNQCHDVPNVFVTDGACMASSACVNPSLTFMALTARAAEYAASRLRDEGHIGTAPRST